MYEVFRSFVTHNICQFLEIKFSQALKVTIKHFYQLLHVRLQALQMFEVHWYLARGLLYAKPHFNVNSYMYLDLKGLFPDACTQSTLSPRFLDFLRLDETLFNIGSRALRSNHEMQRSKVNTLSMLFFTVYIKAMKMFKKHQH